MVLAQRDGFGLAEQIYDPTRRPVAAGPAITPDKIEKLALLLRDKLHHGLSKIPTS
jgi:hypothetical protein